MISHGRVTRGALLGLVFACAGCHAATRVPDRGGTVSLSREQALGASVDVLRYDARIELDVVNKSVTGETAIVFSYRAPGPRTLRFPRNELTIVGASYLGRATAFQVDDVAIVIPLPDRPPVGVESLTIAYHATPTRGLVFGERLVYANFFTCHWMVCSEEPGDKAAFGLDVIAPAGYRVVGSGRRVEEHADSTGRVHSRWEEERPYSPYLFGFAAGDLTETVVDAGPVKLRLVGQSSSESADSLRRKFQDTPRMMAFLESRAGLPLPHDDYTQVLVRGAEAQEKSSFALIGTTYLDPIVEDPMEDWVIVHELAHQWWGNLLTCRDWSHFWLNEGMATFMVAAYKEQRWGKSAYDREVSLWQERRKAAVDAGFDVPLAYAREYPSLGIRRAIQYSKGALFLHTLRGRLGEDAFWRGIAAYTAKQAGGTVTSSDFQGAMAEASDVDLAPLFREWVDP